MKRLLDVLMVTTMLGVFVGGLVFIVAWNSPEPHVPYKDVTLPNSVHILHITLAERGRDGFRPA